MSPAEEACEILPEKSQAGELGGKVFQQRSMIQNYFYFKKKKKRSLWLLWGDWIGEKQEEKQEGRLGDW